MPNSKFHFNKVSRQGKKSGACRLGLSRLLLALLLFAISALPAAAQKAIHGKVISKTNGEPLSGVSVQIKDEAGSFGHGAITDEDGLFNISAADDQTVRFTRVGYSAVEMQAGSIPDQVVLTETSQDLDAVVVVGYGTQRKRDLTGATVHLGGDNLAENKSINTLTNLQGKAPGVQVTSTSGQPGDGVKIRIRGIGTNGNTNPLYVVDGMPTTDISYLNPSDIASLDILKDAASAAIYGTRAANGVVLITTVKGNTGGIRTALHAYYGLQNPIKEQSLLSAKQYAIIMNEAAVNSGKSPYYYYSQQEIDSMGAGTDWQKAATNSDAPIQNYDLSFSGGNGISNYASSVSYQKQEGIISLGKSYYERFGFRINSDHKVYKDILKFGENLSFTHSNQSGIGTGNIYGNSIRGLLNTSPTFPVYNADGSFGTSGMSSEEVNPVAAIATLNQNKTITDRIFGNTYLEATILNHFKLRSSFGIDLSFYSTNSFIPVYDLAANSSSTTSEADQGMYRNFTWTWDNTLTYDNQFGRHKLNVLVGTSAQEFSGFNVSGSKQNLSIEDFDHAIINNGMDGTQKAYGTRSEDAMNSYMARVNYSFADKYLLSAIIRRDGSTKFGSNHRWGNFPSFSAGWILSNEDFLKNANWLNFLKLRAGWGQNGNDQIRSFAYLATVSSSQMGYYFGGEDATSISVGAAPTNVANPDLKWEASEQEDIGLDATLFNHFNLTFDWYQKTSKDWLVQPPIPALVGTGAPYINGGDIQNRGIEIALNYNAQLGDVNLSVGGNIAFNHNEARSVPNNDGIIHGATNLLSSSTEEFYRIQNGFPVGYFWGYKTAGVFQTQAEVNAYTGANGLIQPNAVAGDVRFVDLNADGSITTADKTMIGDPNPNFTYGGSVSASYKGFDLNLNISGVSGNQIVDGTRANDRSYNNYSTSILDRWHGEGTSNSTPRVTLGDEANKNYKNFSDLYVQNGDFMRLKSLSVGYDFKKGLLPNLPFDQFRFYVSATNLFTITKYTGIDPEVGYGNTESDGNNWSSGIDLGYYPQPRTVLFGLDVRF
ncbi:TonB-linked outer membrane protein, SusC/RagA family [Arachidicoccus rhizosphaerae]|uniref:TonB-linked outer membrane protein, SusC/RagA family n=1 Tax=Arachidicoccus rhizosphaerae TaxID=551991 RepID=A0A1H3VGY4_9BACT|nr:TonB-dependent receptor [Arachidicoccus rhizosphaerae]SDZ73448.1 TonB-linked outer membrane protein, SusC/RagA family [Arachidicoccus rhizosphaerae]